MASIILPSTLSARAGGVRFEVAGATAFEALRRLEQEVPALVGWVLDEQGRLRRHVTLFVNDEAAGLDRRLSAGDEIYVVQAISGG